MISYVPGNITANIWAFTKKKIEGKLPCFSFSRWKAITKNIVVLRVSKIEKEGERAYTIILDEASSKAAKET